MALLLTAVGAQAASQIEYARVISSTPIYERGISRECTDIPVTRMENPTDESRLGGSIVGGIVGGLLGHQIGKGSGRDVATVAGAIAGTVTGRNLADHPSITETTRQECRSEERRNLVGYSVRYDFHGEQRVMEMPHDPGSQIEMRVSAEPIFR